MATAIALSPGLFFLARCSRNSFVRSDLGLLEEAAHANAHSSHTHTHTSEGLTGFPIKRKWHYPRTYCCADFSFYYTELSAAAVHKKPHGLLPRSRIRIWGRSNCGSINIICVCLCDTSRSDPLALLVPLPIQHPLTAHLAVAIYGRTPENFTHSVWERRIPTLIGFRGIVFGHEEVLGGRVRTRDLIASYMAEKIYNTAGQNNKGVTWPQNAHQPTL